MNELASTAQLRTAYVRWALITVPAILLLGLLSAGPSGSGYNNFWFDKLAKPAAMPPVWVFPFTWSVLYVLMGLSVASILNARGCSGRGLALSLFLVQLALNLAWSPAFFGMHRIMLALGLLIAGFCWAVLTTAMFWTIRRRAAWLMMPSLGWLLFAGAMNWQVHLLNPRGLALVPATGDTQIIIQ